MKRKPSGPSFSRISSAGNPNSRPRHSLNRHRSPLLNPSRFRNQRRSLSRRRSPFLQFSPSLKSRLPRNRNLRSNPNPSRSLYHNLNRKQNLSSQLKHLRELKETDRKPLSGTRKRLPLFLCPDAFFGTAHDSA